MEDLYDEVKDYQSEISEIILNNQENLEELLVLKMEYDKRK